MSILDRAEGCSRLAGSGGKYLVKDILQFWDGLAAYLVINDFESVTLNLPNALQPYSLQASINWVAAGSS